VAAVAAVKGSLADKSTNPRQESGCESRTLSIG
jgi:hypothetical protein